MLTCTARRCKGRKGNNLELHDTGNFTFGYIGDILDVARSLLYLGNRQYYDPTTGRFLTRAVNPESPNAYVPWDPVEAILGRLVSIDISSRRSYSLDTLKSQNYPSS